MRRIHLSDFIDIYQFLVKESYVSNVLVTGFERAEYEIWSATASQLWSALTCQRFGMRRLVARDMRWTSQHD